MANGIKSGALVPICFEHSLWAIVAMLGVLKAGAAYVPLDPEWPFKRCQEITAQIDAKMVLTSAACSQFLSMPASTLVVDSNITSSDHDMPLLKNDASTPAYVLFTSGLCG